MKGQVLVLAAIAALATATPAFSQYYQKTTYMSYDSQTGQYDLPMNIWYALPNPTAFGPGPYPVFMWTPATFEPFNDSMSLVFATEMSLRGFIGATVQYGNLEPVESCQVYQTRTQAVYDATRATSAVSVLCNLPQASCTTGITTAGTSEGGAMAIMAKNFAPNVKATFAMSISDYEQDTGLTMALCLAKPMTAIPANRLMIVDGANDQVFGVGAWLQATSGVYCLAGAQYCFSSDGSGAGWYIVQPWETVGGNPDHCYYLKGGCGNTSYEPNWVVPSQYQWSLAPNLDWLASFGTYRHVVSAIGR